MPRFAPLFAILLLLGAPGPARAAHTLGPVTDPAALRAAAAKAAPGDTIVMADGEWKDADLVFDAAGTASSPITLKAQTPGKVVITGRSSLRIGGDYLVVDGLKFISGYTPGKSIIDFRNGSRHLANHCRLTNCAIVEFNPPDPKTQTTWVAVYGRFNRVDHCWFTGMRHKGVQLCVIPTPGGEPNESRIDHNYFGDRARGDENGYETIRVGTSEVSMQISRATIESNLFLHCDGEMEVISNKTCENVYRGNTFIDCRGQLCLRHGKRCRVEGNFFFGTGVSNASGVRVIDEGHVVVNNYFSGLKGNKARGALILASGIPKSPLSGYMQVKNALIAFNTFVDCRESIVIGNVEGGTKASLPPANCTLANNLVVGRSGPLMKMLNAPVGMKYEGNIMFGAAVGLEPHPGINVADPKLIAGPDKLMRPAPDSPALGAAAGEYPAVTDDMDGQPRPAARQDVGADQASPAPHHPPPPHPRRRRAGVDARC